MFSSAGKHTELTPALYKPHTQCTGKVTKEAFVEIFVFIT